MPGELILKRLLVLSLGWFFGSSSRCLTFIVWMKASDPAPAMNSPAEQEKQADMDLSKLSGELATISLPDLKRRIDAIDTPVGADQDIIELLNNRFKGIEKRITWITINYALRKRKDSKGRDLEAPVAIQ